VFVNSKRGCARLARSLEREGLKTTALHGDKSQDERLKALEAFKKGEVDLLVCTDVAARGLDIKDVPAVFNFDVPFNAEDYVHRIGRTGRAGASGLAVSFVAPSDTRLVADIQKLINAKLEIEPVEFDEDRPRISEQGRINDGRRMYREAEGSEQPDEPGTVAAAPRERREPRETREPRERREYAPRRSNAPRDPFFDQPYESTLPSEAQPAWEAAAKTAAPRGISANIKPKKKVAALFKTVTEPQT